MSIADCAAIVERGDPDRFRAAMLAPVAAREALFPLYAFNVEVTRAPWVSQEPMICEMRLQWWLDVLDEVEQGQPARAHEVAEPLAALLLERSLPLDPLKSLVQARRWDIYRNAFDGKAHFQHYIEATSAGLMWVSAQALGTPVSAEETVRKIGWASGVAALLRAVPELEARGRRPLVDGRPSGVEELAQMGLEKLKEARKEGVPRVALPALRAAWRARRTLTQALAEPTRVADGRLEENPVALRLGLVRRAIFNDW